MASIIFLFLISVVISVQGGFVWQNDDNQWSGYQPIRMPNFYFPPLPPPPPLPPYPPLPGFLPLPQLPPYLPLPPYPEIPSPGEIKNMKGEPGQVYAGVGVKAASGVVKDKDGKKVKRKGGATIVTNNNGKVKEIKIGDSPPDINDPIVIPAMPKFHQFPSYQFPEFQPIVFEPIKPIDPEEIRNRGVGDNENYVGVHTSSYSHSSDIDGVKSAGGGTHTLTNVNGKVDEEKVDVGTHN